LWIGPVVIRAVEVGKDARGYNASLSGDAVDERWIEDVTAEQPGGGGAADESTRV
jgi:hypothetical protein